MRLPSIISLALLFCLALGAGVYPAWLGYEKDQQTVNATAITGELVEVRESSKRNFFTNEKVTTFIPYYSYTVDGYEYTSAGEGVEVSKNPFPDKAVKEEIFYDSSKHGTLINPEANDSATLYLVAGGIFLSVLLLSLYALTRNLRKTLKVRNKLW